LPDYSIQYRSGADIHVGDQVRLGSWLGTVVFVLGRGEFAQGFTEAQWSHLGRGFMLDTDQAGLVFHEEAPPDLELVARALRT